MAVVNVGLLRLPRAFVDDHISRCLPAPEFVRENKVRVWVESTDKWLPELYSDAAHYEGFTDEDRKDNLRIVQVAERLLKALRAAGWTKAEAAARYPHKDMEAWTEAELA